MSFIKDFIIIIIITINLSLSLSNGATAQGGPRPPYYY
jgi:hypothetical protein